MVNLMHFDDLAIIFIKFIFPSKGAIDKNLYLSKFLTFLEYYPDRRGFVNMNSRFHLENFYPT